MRCGTVPTPLPQHPVKGLALGQPVSEGPGLIYFLVILVLPFLSYQANVGKPSTNAVAAESAKRTLSMPASLVFVPTPLSGKHGMLW